MKHKTFFLTLIFLGTFGLHAQVPVMNSITGPTAVCSPPASPKSYTASASNSPTSYSWSTLPSASVVIGNSSAAVTSISFPNTNLTYTVYCSATNGSGTSSTIAYIVTVFETPTVTFSGANSFCQGSSINLSASPTVISGSSTLTYSWFPSTGLSSTTGHTVQANPSVTTTYSVLLTLGSCTNVASVIVTVQSLPQISASASSSVICIGESSTLTVSGSALVYLLGTNPVLGGVSVVSPTTTTNYLITGIALNSCTNSIQIPIVVNQGPSINVLSTNSVICAGETNSLMVTGTGTNYSVNAVASSANFTVSPLTTSNYTITTSGSNGCISSSVFTQSVSLCTAVEKQNLNENILIYPNPNNGDFILRSKRGESAFIFNELGQLTKSVYLEPEREYKITGLDSGIYIIISSSIKKKIVVSSN